MIDLSDRLGVVVSLVGADDGFRLRLDNGLASELLISRTIDALRPVMLHPGADTPRVPYWMHRGVHVPEHEELIAEYGVRYDLTMFNPGVLSTGGEARDGHEFVKTFGHYHPVTEGVNRSFPEVYDVAHGHCLFVLQESSDVQTIQRALLVEAEAGDVVVIPPNHGHVTVVIGDTPLVMANWVAAGFDSLYAPYRNLGGAAFFVVSDGADWKAIPNGQYGVLPALEHVRVSDLPCYGILTTAPIYSSFIKQPDSFQFLVQP